jgi:hypothetical protein
MQYGMPPKRGYLRGNPIIWRDGEYVYEDTGERTVDGWETRPCGHCGKPFTAEGHDGCLGTLPFLMNACCGHGIRREAYVQFWGGKSVHRGCAVVILKLLKLIKYILKS